MEKEPANPVDKAAYFLTKAVEAREKWYQGQEEEITKARVFGLREVEGKIRWANNLEAKELLATNRWHMLQSLAFGLISCTRYLAMIVTELREVKQLLREKR